MSLVDRLRQCAEIAGSGDELSRRAAIPRRTLEYYLAGESDPKAKRLTAIVEATGVNGHWLLTGSGPMLANDARLPSNRATAAMDASRLGSALSEVERSLAATQQHVPAERRAKIVLLVYEHLESGKTPEESAAFARQLIELTSGQ
ncbi:helix-turn-helix domain-containing protein [Cupriavidus basilensis]|uniref:helix-turn-helix domain-containing protein n=1 Tax=Cupriavidus basilensis TaxID=68895 RepID=UPI0020A67861|nr:helix-turn-helix domain-containing protein [Cupriavidus basilensis]MCP3018420.1 helix-turn-helix domain-containing protein [Cupriavidus basilensis]